MYLVSAPCEHLNNRRPSLCIARTRTEWILLVRIEGLEPPRLSALRSKRSESTISPYPHYWCLRMGLNHRRRTLQDRALPLSYLSSKFFLVFIEVPGSSTGTHLFRPWTPKNSNPATHNVLRKRVRKNCTSLGY